MIRFSPVELSDWTHYVTREDITKERRAYRVLIHEIAELRRQPPLRTQTLRCRWGAVQSPGLPCAENDSTLTAGAVIQQTKNRWDNSI